MPRPLEGVRVLDTGISTAGPYAARLLGDLGADVIKVEPLAGENTRGLGLRYGDAGYLYHVNNYNKRSVALMLQHPRGRDLFLELVAKSDVVIENFAIGTMDKWGVGYAACREANPAIIYCSVKGFGESGPWAGLRAFDTVTQALCGLMYSTGKPGDPPLKAGPSVCDLMGAAVSSMAALEAGVHAVASGACELVVAGGVDVMSTTPHGATLVPGAMPFGPGVADRYRDAGGLIPAGVAAERLAVELGLDRAALDAVAVRSHARAAVAGARPEVLRVPVRVLDRDRGEVVSPGTSINRDQLPRADLTAEELAANQPLFEPDGVITAGNVAPAADGAAVVLIGSETAAERLAHAPLATIAGVAVTGADPIGHFAGAASAATKALGSAERSLDDLDRIELAEPFAAVVAGWEVALGVEPGTANPQGGGLATGEPTGAVGAILVASLAYALAAGAGSCGLAVVAGGGLGGAVVLRT